MTDSGNGAISTGSKLNLAGARQKKGISLEEIWQSTRIKIHFLQAIEAEDFDKLPGEVYIVNYLRQYAQAIGYDESILLKRYRAQAKPEQPLPNIPSEGRFSRWLHSSEPLRALCESLMAGRSRSQHPV